MRLRLNRVATRLGSWAFVRAQRWCLRRSAEQAARAGERVGRLAFRLSRKHRERALSNLALAFPELSEEDRRALALRVFEHFGRNATDFLRSELRSDEEVLRTTTTAGREHLEEAFGLGRGVLVITGHLGNWERGAQWFSASGFPMSVVARDANDSELNDLVLRMRRHAGVEVIPRGNAARPVLAKLKANGVVAILPDQNSNEAFVPFFGHPAGTALGPAVLHLRTGAPLLPLACISAGVGRLHIEILPYRVYDRASGVKPERIMEDLHRDLESLIRRWPEQYLWLHDRWKSARRKGWIA
ncbi:MAG: lysophospholipid acyltransferase family protein [Fimbriimonadales bacterium]|nr:lysophospholipid acyltransferase family protein [Fimbriimonadales bacterium]